MRPIRQRLSAIARLLVVAFVYALLLPPGSAPCIHHRAAPSHAAMSSHEGHAARGPAAHETQGDSDHAGGHLGCSCCIGGMCGGNCGGGCRLPLGCTGCGGALRPTRLDDNRPVVLRRVVADTRVDLSAPLVRPQAPRAPPA